SGASVKTTDAPLATSEDNQLNKSSPFGNFFLFLGAKHFCFSRIILIPDY
ncbi:hypothetical protein HMPREF9519_02151, partial [Enterococcus faecalis TX1346]